MWGWQPVSNCTLVTTTLTQQWHARTPPQLQYNTQLFLKSNLGIPATSVGPRGAQNIIRRIVLDAPALGLVIDRHGTAFDAISIPPGTISSLRFTLCGFDGKAIDLNGLSWSFSITIFKE